MRAQAVEPSARLTLEAFVAFASGHGGAAPWRVPPEARTQPDAAARYVLRRSGITEPPVPAFKVADALSVPVFEWDFPDEISGAFVDYQGAVAIAVNRGHPSTRQRFTAAHELGHFIFSPDRRLFVDLLSRERMPPLEDDADREDERRANWFAADLLMPAPWVRRDVREHGAKLSLLSQRYDVSEQALWYRLLSLRLIESESRSVRGGR